MKTLYHSLSLLAADPAWQRQMTYSVDTLMTEVTLHHPGLALTLFCHDIVDFNIVQTVHRYMSAERVDLSIAWA